MDKEKIKYTEEEETQVLDLYHLGITRPSKIAAILSHRISLEKVKEILFDFTDNEYKNKIVNNIKSGEILRLYSEEEKDVLDILSIYPELTFGQVKNIIEDYYHLFSMKKPRKIKFPRKLVEEHLQLHNIEETCEEFGYSKERILKKLGEEKDIEDMNKEELFDFKMKILERDVNRVEQGTYSLGKFKRKYMGHTPQQMKPLITQYKMKS